MNPGCKIVAFDFDKNIKDEDKLTSSQDMKVMKSFTLKMINMLMHGGISIQ